MEWVGGRVRNWLPRSHPCKGASRPKTRRTGTLARPGKRRRARVPVLRQTRCVHGCLHLYRGGFRSYPHPERVAHVWLDRSCSCREGCVCISGGRCHTTSCRRLRKPGGYFEPVSVLDEGRRASCQKLPAAMASLDVDLPLRGREYLFTTSRGRPPTSPPNAASRSGGEGTLKALRRHDAPAFTAVRVASGSLPKFPSGRVAARNPRRNSGRPLRRESAGYR